MASATLTSKGQITIPQAVRDGLHMKAGDKFAFEILPDGSFRAQRISQDLGDLVGRLARYALQAPIGPADIAAAREAEYLRRAAGE